jgi:hypothetical protein
MAAVVVLAGAISAFGGLTTGSLTTSTGRSKVEYSGLCEMKL